MAENTETDMQQPEIEEIRKLLMKELYKASTISKFKSEIASKSTNGAKVKICYQYLHQYQLLPKKPPNTKCDQVCIEFIDKGGDVSGMNRNRAALKLCNIGIKHGSSSGMMSFAYTVRANVLFELKKYKECILDIERALSANCREFLKKGLLQQKIKCEEAIKSDATTDCSNDFNLEEAREKLFTLPDKRMDGVPCASASIQIGHFPSMGRGLIAAKNIQPGQVLIREKPYVSCLEGDEIGLRCYFCFSRNDAMIPCETCTHVMFCDEECRSKSWNEGHKFECPIMLRLVNMRFNASEVSSLRAVSKARSQYSSWNEMFEAIDAVEKETSPSLKGFLPGPDGVPVYDSKSYPPVHMLATLSEKRDMSDVIHRCVASASILHMLKEYTPLFEDHLDADDDILSLDDNNYFWRIGGLLTHMSMLLEINSHSIDITYHDPITGYKFNKFGSGLYPFSSLLNHSCSGNIIRVSCGTDLIIIASRSIKKGQQIFDNYGLSYTTKELPFRTFHFENKFKFTCKCEACVNKWPLWTQLKKANFKNKYTKDNFRNTLNQSVLDRLGEGDKKYAYDILRDLCKYMAMLEECVPCKEHVHHGDAIRECFLLLGNYEYKQNKNVIPHSTDLASLMSIAYLFDLLDLTISE